jgi:hypothetical protein
MGDMRGTQMKSKAFLSAAIVASAASFATAGTLEFDQSMSFLMGSPTLDPIIGSGISNANFVRSIGDDSGNQIEIGLKAHARYAGDLANVNEVYTAQRGTTVSPTPAMTVGSTWNYTLVGSLGSKTIADYQIDLMIDFDPTAGVENYTTIDITAFALSEGLGGLGVIASSENLEFDFLEALAGTDFDPNAIGEYKIKLSVQSLDRMTTFASVNNTINVVPLPPAAIAGLAMLGGIGAYRRFRK